MTKQIRLKDDDYELLIERVISCIIESSMRAHTTKDIIEFIRRQRPECTGYKLLTETQVRNLLAFMKAHRRFTFKKVGSRKIYVEYNGI